MKKVSLIISILVLIFMSAQAQDCIDYTIANDHINYPGIYAPETVSLDYDGSGQTIELGIYGNFNNWNTSPFTLSMYGTTIAVNGGSPVPIYAIMATGVYNMTAVTIALDTTSLNSEYVPNATVSHTSGKIFITGAIDNVTITLNTSGLFYSCTESNNQLGDCEDLTLTNGSGQFPGIYGGDDVTRVFDGSNQSIDLGIYGLFNGWNSGGQQNQTFFSVNGSTPVSLAELSLNVNYTIDGVLINLDTTPVDESYFSSSTLEWTSGTLNFSGLVQTIVMTQFESGLLFDCSLPLVNEYSACEDFTEINDSPSEPGIYGGGDYTLNYDGSDQQIELAIYGLFNFWNAQNLGQADQTFFTLNGDDPISLETIFNNVPYTVNGISIDLNTDFLGGEFPLDGSFTSGTIIFEGNIDSIVMSQFESGLLSSCPETYNVITDCDYVFEGDSQTFQGYINSGSYSFPFDGSNQEVQFGFYDYATWEQMGGEWPDDQAYFSVNGSDLISVDSILNNQPFLLNNMLIEIDTTPINQEYNLPAEFTSGTITFTGEIVDITTQQTESGIVFICTEPIIGDQDCQDFTVEDNDPEFPGIYGGSDATIPFDGSYQTVTMGLYGLFDNWAPSGQQNETFFTINNGQPVSLKFLENNSPLVYEGVFIDMDLNSLNDEYLSESSLNWTSATISFTGAIEEIIMTQFESGLLFACTEPDLLEDCVDYTEWNSDPNLPGIWLLFGNYTLNYDSTYQEVSMGIYGSFLDWDMDTEGNLAPYAGFILNGEYISLETIVLNSPYTFNDIVIEIDTNDISGEYPIDDSFTTFTTGSLTFTGNISEIKLGLMEWGLFYSCTEPIEEEELGCLDYTEDNNDPEFPGIYLNADANVSFDGSNQMVSIGVYGSWLDWAPDGPQNVTFFTINGGDPISMGYIKENFPLEYEGVNIDLDLTSLTDEYLSEAVYNWTTATIIITGEIDNVIMTQSESGMLFSCTEPVIVQQDCIDYTEGNSEPNSPGIYLVIGDYQIDFDSTYQEVSLGVYGGFIWTNIGSGQADQTFFSVNGGDPISLETIYLNQPYLIDDIEITVDTTALSNDYPLADYWSSGTVIFTGHISQVVMTQFESGLLFSCTNPAEEECDDCDCQIDADFSYVSIGSYFSFVSSGIGTEYSWDFGDGNSSNEENPTYIFTSPNTYNVCMTSFNLTDTCSITICQSIQVTSITPETNIITPNNDGFDDQTELYCGNVTVYDRNGIIVAELISQEFWNGTNENGMVLPMGEYILKCNETDVIRTITILR